MPGPVAAEHVMAVRWLRAGRWWLVTHSCRVPRLVMAVRADGAALPGGGCPWPGLRQDRKSLQRGCRRLSRCVMHLVKQQLGDDVQACDEVAQGRRVLRDQGPHGSRLQLGRVETRGEKPDRQLHG